MKKNESTTHKEIVNAKVDEAENLFAVLKDDLKSILDTKALRNKHKLRAAISIVLAFSFTAIFGYVNDKPLLISLIAVGLIMCSFLFFFSEMAKMNKYSISDEDEVLFNCYEAYTKIRAFKKIGSDVYLNDALKAMKGILRGIWVTSISTSWKTIREFREQLTILAESIEKKILSNLSRGIPKERLDVIILEIAKLANVTRDMSTTAIREYVENLRANEAIPEGEYTTPSRKMIQSFKNHHRAWEFTKSIVIFTVSVSVVVSFVWLLCEWQKANFGDYISVVIMGTIGLFGILLAALRIKTK